MTTNAISPYGRRSAKDDKLPSSDPGRPPATRNGGSAHCGLRQTLPIISAS
jgi:hypothetical protein